MTEQLPIIEIIPEIRKRLASSSTLILQAPPGAGKSTVLPLELLNEPWLYGKKILMLEPRRLAAKSVAGRMSSLKNESVGTTIGYRVRFDNKISTDTKIEVLTEGILTRMLQHDNALDGVGLVIFDEFHERSLHADLALALCREIQQVLREDLRILVMSATLDGEQLSSLLGDAPVLTSLGRQYPIQLEYISQEANTPVHLNVAKAIRKALSQQTGDVLAFLPGAGEIIRTQEILKSEAGDIVVLPLYGDLPIHKQQEAMLPDPSERRKVVLATSIAETSLTIEGVKIVVDSGYSRGPRFDPKTGLTRLETVKVTKDAADQRAGRAGRLGPGICYRLWNESTHQHLADHRTPEIMEADLAPLILELAQWGIKNINNLSWLSVPPAGSVSQARELLAGLGALSEDQITERGKAMLRLPTHPRIAHLLLEGKEFRLSNLAIDIASILEERDPLDKGAGTNLTIRVEVLRKWRKKEYVSADRNVLERIERLSSAWRKIFQTEIDNTIPSDAETGRLIAAAYPERIAKKRDMERYRLANGRVAKLSDHDPLLIEDWIAIAHLDAGVNEGRIYLAAPVDPEDLDYLCIQKTVVKWDRQKGILIGQKEKRIGDIIVESSPLEKIPEEDRVRILCEAAKTEGAGIFNWTESAIELQERILSLKSWRPEETWPDVSRESLMQTLSQWLPPYLSSVRKREDFFKMDLAGIIMGLLPWHLSQKLDELAPEKIKVPSGSEIKIKYDMHGGSPVLAVRLQEVFGLVDTPLINEGKTKILMHLLSPGYKPVQVTQDLKSFWKNTYPEVRKELRVRYLKHHWPEDPWNAEAVRGPKKRKI